MDFYFSEKSHSARFVDFLEGVVPTKASHHLMFSLVRFLIKAVSALIYRRAPCSNGTSGALAFVSCRYRNLLGNLTMMCCLYM